jgi:hypothetical protein
MGTRKAASLPRNGGNGNGRITAKQLSYVFSLAKQLVKAVQRVPCVQMSDNVVAVDFKNSQKTG